MPRLLRCFLRAWGRNEIPLRAAALTYYTVLSIFPLLLLVTSGVGWLLRSPVRQRQVERLLMGLLPQGSQVITQVVQDVVLAHSLPNYIAALTLLWSASGFLRGLLHTIAIIHDGQAKRSGWWVQWWSIALLILLIPGLLGATTLLGIASRLVNVLPWGAHSALLRLLTHDLVLFGLAAAIFYLLFRFVPRTKNKRRYTLLAAALSATLWLALNLGFAQYLALTFKHLNLIYGSLAAGVALMVYFYLGNLAILLGAQIHALLGAFPRCR